MKIQTLRPEDMLHQMNCIYKSLKMASSTVAFFDY